MTEHKHTPGPELKPCPFCADPMEDRGYGATHVGNHKCPLRIYSFEISAWNTRATDPLRDAAPELLTEASKVMALLDEHGADIVPHLLDTDDNPGQRLRAAIAKAKGGEDV